MTERPRRTPEQPGCRPVLVLLLCLLLCTVRGSVAAVLAGASRSVLRDTLPISLIAVTGAQLQDARKVAPDAALFEVRTTLTSQDLATGTPHIRFAFSDFASPGDDVRFVEVSEWFGSQSRRTVQTLDYIRVVCNGGAARADCGQGTGQPEAHQKHLPLHGWRFDLPGLVRIVRADSLVARTPMTVTVTTAGRAGLPSLPAGRAIIKVLEAPRSYGRPGATAHFIILDAGNGSVIQRGIYRVPPPAA